MHGTSDLDAMRDRGNAAGSETPGKVSAGFVSAEREPAIAAFARGLPRRTEAVSGTPISWRGLDTGEWKGLDSRGVSSERKRWAWAGRGTGPEDAQRDARCAGCVGDDAHRYAPGAQTGSGRFRQADGWRHRSRPVGVGQRSCRLQSGMGRGAVD